MAPLLSTIDHIAMIMDGNGRWAKDRSHLRVWGHVRGSSVVSKIVTEACKCHLKALTLYTFSTENWLRPEKEISTLFSLLKKFLIKERAKLLKNKIKFRVMGNISMLPGETKDLIRELENETKDMSGLKLTLAFGYGGRDEIIRGINNYIKERKGLGEQEITEKKFSKYMYYPDLGDVDLLIRTGGDQRISNFLLWQMAYAEFYFTPTKWPEFTAAEFKNIIDEVRGRERRFGTVVARATSEAATAWNDPHDTRES